MAGTHLGGLWTVCSFRGFVEGAAILPSPAFQRHLLVEQLGLASAQVQVTIPRSVISSQGLFVFCFLYAPTPTRVSSPDLQLQF